MNEPKKRGRPSKVEVAAREAKPEGGDVTHNGDTSGQLERAQDEQSATEQWVRALASSDGIAATKQLKADMDTAVHQKDDSRERAQAYAMMVWAGQSADLGRAERIARCERALIAQNLPTEGIAYPGTQDAEDWTDDDEKPVTWRKAGA